MSVSFSASWTASCSWPGTSSSIAFSYSGRLRVILPMRPSFSKITFFMQAVLKFLLLQYPIFQQARLTDYLQ